ncbi:uncharacterized protein LOC130975293 [Arachis stenosperma]|uniref:uncharacterized protein LOC130975293 n=1 Tax=Arachis stenosperma TaxID=217475 RepID=UPI0025AD97ED|nr:uncharacterized protein LOC130975293 [Arachis stenosperma]
MENNLTSTLNGLNFTLQALISQIGSLNTSNNQPASSNALPSQPLHNPKGGINAITLRSGTTLQERNQEEPIPQEYAPIEDMVEVEDVEEEDKVQDMVEEEATQPENSASKITEATRDAIPIPFPHLAQKPRKQMELDTKMDKINELGTIPLGSSISALMRDITEKCSDPDKSIIIVVGIAEDVLVSIKGLTFSIDFYILEMAQNDSGRPSSILLGRPFLKTSKFKLDAFLGTYSCEIDGRAVRFNLTEVMKHPLEDHSIFQCNIIDETLAAVHQEEVAERHRE